MAEQMPSGERIFHVCDTSVMGSGRDGGIQLKTWSQYDFNLKVFLTEKNALRNILKYLIRD